MLNKVVQQWFADPDFKALSTIDKQRALGGYFDDKLSGKFSDLPENELSSVKNDFIEINLGPHRPPPPSRGVLTDLGVSVARGIIGAPETYARALAAMDKAVGVDDGKSREMAEDIASFRDDVLPVSKEASAPGWRRDWTGAAESTVHSLAVTAPGMAAGVAGAAARGGGKLVAAAAGQLLGAPLFGMAQYDKAYDEYVKKGVPKDQAHDAAVMEGLSETGTEFFSDVLDILLLRGGGFTKPLRDATKNSAKRVIQSSFSSAAKKGLGVAASEEVAELTNTAIQAEVQRSTGASDDTFWQAIKDNFGQITVSSLIFGALGGGLHKARSSQVKSLITDKDADPEERLGAVREVYDEIARTDPGLAERWRTGATMAVLQGKAISEEIEEEGSRVQGVEGSSGASPVGAAGEDTTEVGRGKAEGGKRKKTAAEILTGRVAPSRRPSVAPADEEIAAGTPLPQDEAKPAISAVEALTGRRAPMRQPSQAPVEIAQQPPAEAAQEAIVTEDVQVGALPPAAEAPGSPVKEPWEMTRREYVESVSAGRVIDDRANQRHKNIVALAIGEGKPVPPEVLAEYPDLVEKPATNAVEALTGRRAPSRRPSEEPAALEPRGEAIAGEPILEGGSGGEPAARSPRKAVDVLTGRPPAPSRRPSSAPSGEGSGLWVQGSETEEIAAGTPLPQMEAKASAADVADGDVLNGVGKPYANANAARFARRGKKLEGSHDVVAVTGGYVLRPKEVSGGEIAAGTPLPQERPRTDAVEALTGKKEARRESQKAEPVEGAAADQVVEKGEAAQDTEAEGLTAQPAQAKDLKFKHGDMVTPTAAGGLNVGFAGRVIDDYFEDGREYVKIEGKGENGLPADSFELQPQPAPAQEKQAPPLAEIMVEIKAYSESGAAMMIKERADTALAENAEQTAMARKILECLNI
jgi:hypothetical protein